MHIFVCKSFFVLVLFFQVKDFKMYISICQKYLDKHGHRAFVTWIMFIRPGLLVVHPGPLKTVLTASAMSVPKDVSWAGVYRMILPWIGMLAYSCLFCSMQKYKAIHFHYYYY